MRRWRGLTAVPSGWGRSVVTVGVFDGVHRGHQQVISTLVRQAQERGLASVVVTFDPHPAEVVRPGSHPPVLCGAVRKAELMEELGVDGVCVLPFTMEFSRLSPESFAHEVLVERLHAATVIVGENFRFGHKAAGDVALLRQMGSRFGFTVQGHPLVSSLGGDPTVFSSTYIRACVGAGDVAQAARALGRPHRIEGVVVRGDGRGRELGFPTANVEPSPNAAIPGDGIYAGYLRRTGNDTESQAALPAAISVGSNPTFAGEERRVEVFVLDFDGALYGEHVAVDFVERLRSMDRFGSVAELQEQIAIDVARTREVLHTD